MAQSVQSVLKPGDVIGKYQVVRCLGIGGMGEVHLVYHRQLKTPRALKLLRMDKLTRGSVYAERFMREARIASRIQHPNIISVMDVENDAASGFFYLVMEYVDGDSLQEILRSGVLSEEQAVHIISEVSKGLAAASEVGLVHRDIKPSNIMISRSGEVKLADLGIAKAADEDVSMTLTMDNTMVGTPAYASPEQCSNAHDVDVRADIYSLGATLYEMVTGLPPFDGINSFDTIAHVLSDEPTRPSLLNANISPALENLILKMMSKKPEDRPQNIAELQGLLKPLQAANIPAELKNLIHERVEREVKKRTSTMITAYRKKQKGERIVVLSVVAGLLCAAAVFFLIQNRNYRRTILNLQDGINKHRNERDELSARVTSMKNQLERLKREHQHYSTEAEQNIQNLTAEITRLKNMLAMRKGKNPQPPAADTERQETSPAAAAPANDPQPPKSDTERKETAPAAAVPANDPAAAGTPASPVHFYTPVLSTEEVNARRETAFKKLRNARRQIARSEDELRAALKALDAEKIRQLLRKMDISFENLLYARGADIVFFQRMIPGYSQTPYVSSLGLLISAAVFYNADSPGWDTKKIHAYLFYCMQHGYRIPSGFVYGRTAFLLKNPKFERNLMSVMEFALTHPDSICSFVPLSSPAQKRMQDPQYLKKRILSRTIYFRDFPDWVDRMIQKGILDPSNRNTGEFSIPDHLYLSIYSQPEIKPAHLRLLNDLEKRGGWYSLSQGDRDLIKAIREGKLAMAQHAVRVEHADLRKKYPPNDNALSYALSDNVRYNKTIVRMLLENGAAVDDPDPIYSFDPQTRKRYRSQFIKTPLSRVIERNDPELIELMLRRNVELADASALRSACIRGNVRMVKLLLKNGTPPGGVRSVYKNGQIIRSYSNEFLFNALNIRNAEIAVMLIQHGVCPDENMLHIAQKDPALKPVADLIRKRLKQSSGSGKQNRWQPEPERKR